MGKYKSIIFDMDGTILNTLEDLTDSVNFTLRRFGYWERHMEEVRRFAGNGGRHLIELSIPDGRNNPHFEEIFKTFREHYLKNCRNKTRPYPEVLDLLDRLSADGFKLAIVSNKNHAAVNVLAKEYFGAYITVAIGERETIRKKPAPDTVLSAMKELGCTAEETLYVGDSEVDMETAVNTGIDCVMVSWGFRDKEEMLLLNPTGMIDEPMELYEFL